jgi:hypothetical protein
MSKYICICGDTFKNKELGDAHVKILADYEIGQHFTSHKLLKNNFRGRLLEWIKRINFGRFVRFSGFYMVYLAFVLHFDIELNWWESTLIGLGLGLAIE